MIRKQDLLEPAHHTTTPGVKSEIEALPMGIRRWDAPCWFLLVWFPLISTTLLFSGNKMVSLISWLPRRKHPTLGKVSFLFLSFFPSLSSSFYLYLSG